MADLGYDLPQCERDWALFDNVTEVCDSDSVQRPTLVMSEDSDLSDNSEKLLREHQRRSRKVNVGRCLQGLGSRDPNPAQVGRWKGRGAPGGTFCGTARMAFDDCLSRGYEVFSGEDVLSASEDELDLEIVNQFLSARSQVMSDEGGSVNQPCFLMPGDKLLPSRYQPCLLVSRAGDGAGAAHRPRISEVHTLRHRWPRDDESLVGSEEKLEVESQHRDHFPALCFGEGRLDTSREGLAMPGFATAATYGQIASSGRSPTPSASLVPAVKDYSISVPEVYEYFYADSDPDDDQNTFLFMRIPLASAGPHFASGNSVLTSIGSLVRDCLDPTRQGSEGQVSVWDPVGYGVSEGESPAGAWGDSSIMPWDGASEGLELRPQAPDTGGTGRCCLYLQRKDICLLCLACASWAMKCLSSQSDMWKAALLVNFSAISAVRYFRQHVTKEKSKCLPGSWTSVEQPRK